jgi:hypothetical protein
MAVVSAFHLFQGTETLVQQDFQVGRLAQSGTALRTVKVVRWNHLGAIGAEADFHAFSLGQVLRYSKPYSTFLSGSPSPKEESSGVRIVYFPIISDLIRN